MKVRKAIAALALCLAALSLGGAPPAAADQTNAVEDIVNVLQQKGLIDEATGDEILAKQERSEAKQAAAKPPVSAASLTEGFVWSGDFRLRDEQFWYGRAFGGSADDDNRLRYRARLGFTKQVNSWALVGLRLTSGTGDYRSTNTSFGQQANWAPFSVYLDRAYAQFALPDPGGIGLASTATGGRIPNPFVWKNGIDKMIWDEDISPTGFSVTSSYSPLEGTKLFGTVGYFVELTQSSDTETKVFGFQLGGSTAVAEKLTVGARASFYDWANVSADPNFAINSTPTANSNQRFGNLPTAFDDDVQIGETSAYVSWSGIEGWPALVWGTLAYNFTAEAGTVNGVRVGPEAAAWGFGIEIGDPKALFLLGIEYSYIPANAVLALYTDSDMFDGYTNREGIGVYLARELAANTELKLSLWDGEPIRTTGSSGGDGPFNPDTWTSANQQANRRRFQADVNFKF
ncbi:MAG: putative porin [Myxococcota bacterium]